MVPLSRRLGRIGSVAALAWALLAAAVPEATEFRAGYDSTGCPVYFIARGERTGETADRPRVFLFPRRGSPADGLLSNLRQDVLFDTTDGIPAAGIWRAAAVRYTEKPFTTPGGPALIGQLRERNGTDADGTPLLKHVSEIASLEQGGFVQVTVRPADGSAGAPWMEWSIRKDPRRDRWPADAVLQVPTRPDGSAIDQEIEQDFLCLLRTGDFLQRPMPRLPPFVQPLPIPLELPPAPSVDLRVTAFRHRFHPDLPPVTLWGYRGMFPGPTLRVRRGERVVVRCVNELPADANAGVGHPWTSCRLESASVEGVGFPGDFCKPGQAREHRLVFPEGGPSTGWIHDARLGFSAQNTYKGLAGFLIATDSFDSGNENDPDPRASRLPSGPYDVPLLLADKEVDTTLDRALAWDPFERDGFLGSLDTVNGVVQPVLRVARRKYRFRLLDAGPTRPYELRWSNGRPFILLGGDDGFLDAPRELPTLRLAVGQRRDVVVDFSAVSLGTEMVLQSGPRRLMKVVVERDAPDPSRVPPQFRPRPAVPAGLPTRTFVIENPRGAWTVNGEAFHLDRPHARLKKGSAEIWVVKNRSQDRRHPVEIRPGPFRILARNGQPVPPDQSNELLPGDELQMLVTAGDAAGRYVLPCSNAVHEDQGLMIRWDVEP